MKKLALLVCLLLPSVALCKTPQERCIIVYEKDSFSGEETFRPKWFTKMSHQQHHLNLDFRGKKGASGPSLEMIVSYKDWVNRVDRERKVQPVSVEVKVGERIFNFGTSQFTFNIVTRPDFWSDSAASNWTDIHVELTGDIIDALYAESRAEVRVTKDDGNKDDGTGPNRTDIVCLRMLIDEYRKLSVTKAGEKPAQP
jgi:hypothetical protein